jgi:hypothetical protein
MLAVSLPKLLQATQRLQQQQQLQHQQQGLV